MRYGSVHSSGKNIIPVGDSVAFRFMLDDYQKGRFWERTIADHDEEAKNIYPDRRTYLQQLKDAVKGNAQEIFICIDTPINDFKYTGRFTEEIIKKVRETGYDKELILSPPNESLEHMSVTEYKIMAYTMATIIRQHENVSLSIGGMASEFTEYYYRISTEIPYYDYIDFHTSNDGNLWSMEWLINNMPADKPLINSEHYLLLCAKFLGYNSDDCINRMKGITDWMFNQPGIRSIYVTIPSIYRENPDDRDVALRYVDKKNNVIMTTRIWYLLKLYEEGKEIMKNLDELKRGDKGYQVIALQNILNTYIKSAPAPEGLTKAELKAYNEEISFYPLKLDGVFGDGTERAVNYYRKKIGFTENGVCSYSMWYMLLTDSSIRFLVSNLFELLKVI